MKTTATPDLRIYVACLASYNNGILYGRWIEASQQADAIQNDIAAMLKASPIPDAEEWAIHDYEGFGDIRLSEYQSIESVAELAAFIEEQSDLGIALYAYFGELDEAKTALDDHYIGAYKSVSDFAQEITEETTDIPSSLQYYIDYEAMARDLAINDVLAIELAFNEVHLFWQH